MSSSIALAKPVLEPVPAVSQEQPPENPAIHRLCTAGSRRSGGSSNARRRRRTRRAGRARVAGRARRAGHPRRARGHRPRRTRRPAAAAHARRPAAPARAAAGSAAPARAGRARGAGASARAGRRRRQEHESTPGPGAVNALPSMHVGFAAAAIRVRHLDRRARVADRHDRERQATRRIVERLAERQRGVAEPEPVVVGRHVEQERVHPARCAVCKVVGDVDQHARTGPLVAQRAVEVEGVRSSMK